MTVVLLNARFRLDQGALVKAIGRQPQASALIQVAMDDIIAEARAVLIETGDREAREVAGRVGTGGAAGPIAPFTARIIPGVIPVGLVTSDHPASVRWEVGYRGTHHAIFRGKRGTRGKGKSWKAPVRVPTPAIGFMRTALLRAGVKPGRRRVFHGEPGASST